VEPLYVGPTRDCKRLQAAFELLQDRSIHAYDELLIMIDEGVYHLEGPDVCHHRDGVNIKLRSGGSNRTRLIYRNGNYRCHGIYVGDTFSLGGIEGISIESDAPYDPPDGHAMGIFNYYGGTIRLGPEISDPSAYGSQTDVVVKGFTVGVCSSKSGSNLNADGAIIKQCRIGALAGHGGLIHLCGARIESIPADGLHLQSYSNGASIYCDNLHIADEQARIWSVYGAGIAGGGVTGATLDNWVVNKDADSFVRINGLNL